jgi:competence protein ComEA
MKKTVQFFTVVFVALFIVGVVQIACAENQQKININTAPVETLVKLKGIGQKHAESIIEYRAKNGPFGKPEDITKVSGIGVKTFEANKDIITVEK